MLKPTGPKIYISGNGGIYESYDGGINWTIIGDASFTNFSHSIKDIKLNPNDNLILLKNKFSSISIIMILKN